MHIQVSHPECGSEPAVQGCAGPHSFKQCDIDRGDESQILHLRKLVPNMEIRNWAVAPHCRARFISSHADYSLLRVNGVTDIECTHRVLSVPLSHPAPLRIRMREMTLAGRKVPDSKVCTGDLCQNLGYALAAFGPVT